MPVIKVQDSDGKEHTLIGNGVFGISIAGGMYVAKIVARENKHLKPLVKAILVYLASNYKEETRQAIAEIEKDSQK